MREVFTHQLVQLQFKGAELRRHNLRIGVHFTYHTRANGDVAQAIDKDHPAGHRVLLIRIEGQRLIKGDVNQPDTVQRQAFHFALGQVVELHDVGLRLFRLLQDAPGVTLHCPARVAGVSRSEESVSVTLENGTVLEGQLLVAADGSRSSLGAQCGVEWRQQPYGQVAVIANVSTAAEHHGRAFERFTQHGPLAMLPMSDGRCSLVWCHPQDKAEEVKAWSDERFCTELQKAFGWRLGRITHAGQRAVYPLSLTTASQSISHRLALVGNAAQTLHPIAGQGFNLGLRDVMSLAETLSQAWGEQKDCGAYSVLSHYQKRRQADKEATIGVTDGLVPLFANRWAPLVAGRNLGLMAMELFIPARDVLAQRTLGWVAR